MLYSLTIYPVVKRTLKINISKCDRFAKKAKFEDSFNLAVMDESIKPCIIKGISKEMYDTFKDVGKDKRDWLFRTLCERFELYQNINDHYYALYQKYFKKITEFGKPHFDDSNLEYSTAFELIYEIKVNNILDESDIGSLK